MRRLILVHLRPTRPILATLVLVAAGGLRHGSPAPAPQIQVLRPETPVTARIGPGHQNLYSLSASSGSLLHVVVEQHGVDAVLSLQGPHEEPPVVADSPNRSWGREEIWWPASGKGPWTLRVAPWGQSAGGFYRLTLLIAPLQSKDRLRIAAQRRIADAERFLATGDVQAATEPLARAQRLWHQLGQRYQEALTHFRIAEVELSGGNLDAAVTAYHKALSGAVAEADARQEAYIQLRLGSALRQRGDLEGAWRIQETALESARRQGSFSLEALVLDHQARALETRGEMRAALERYRLALALYRRLGNREGTAGGLAHVGICASRLGLLPEAEEKLSEAAALYQDLADEEGEGRSLAELGWVYRLQALYGGGAALRERARLTLERALGRWRAAGNRDGEAGTLDRLGTLYRDSGRWNEALACYRRSLTLLLRHPEGHEIGHSFNNLAELRLDRHDFGRARQLASDALARFRALPVPDPEGEAYALFLLGRAAAGLGKDGDARKELGEALDRFETLRARLEDETLTVPFFALRQLYFEGAIEAWMGLDARRSRQGFSAAALVAAERAHMRTLIDGIAERRRRGGGQGGTDEIAAVSVEQIQRELLDGETLLLEYVVGEKRSFLWVVGRDEISPYALPGRSVLEPLVDQALRNLSSRTSRPETDPSLLAQMLLGPLTVRPGIRRLAIVSDGPLLHLPFAALPWGAGGRPLLQSYEVVRLPSATTLRALRRRHADSPSVPGRAIAILADPVFSALDLRVTGAERFPSVGMPEGQTRNFNPNRLERLRFSRDEALAIAALSRNPLVALDFVASREVLESAAVRQARILHLATHGRVSEHDPDSTGIVLSMVDPQGRPLPGFLRAEEIAGLDLQADLVVLASCESALGPDVRGEGLMGLSRAFLHAGARQVVASLWDVDDRASTRLMTHFYKGLLHDRLPPAAALRRAQLALRADPRTARPYFWAGFELQGDWR